jgi:hypothetical protein
VYSKINILALTLVIFPLKILNIFSYRVIVLIFVQ